MRPFKPHDIASAIETRTCYTSIDENGILRGTMKDGAREDLADAQANVATARRLCAGKKLPILCDYRNLLSQTREAQVYYGSQEVADIYSACAILVDHTVGTVVANFYLGLRKPKTPTKVFDDASAAYQWLQKVKDQDEI